MIANVVLQIQAVNIFNDQEVFGSVPDLVLPAIIFAVKRNRRQWDDQLIDQQYNIGPLVTDLESFAMIESLNIFCMKAATVLNSTID